MPSIEWFTVQVLFVLQELQPARRYCGASYWGARKATRGPPPAWCNMGGWGWGAGGRVAQTDAAASLLSHSIISRPAITGRSIHS